MDENAYIATATGDIFDIAREMMTMRDRCDPSHVYLVHGVNTSGVMGAGIAKTVRAHYGEEMFSEYQLACQTGALRPGEWTTFSASRTSHEIGGTPTLPTLVNLASQDRPGRYARTTWLGDGLDSFLHQTTIRTTHPVIVLLPWIGAGIGGLRRMHVARIYRALAQRYINRAYFTVVTHPRDAALTRDELNVLGK